MKENRKKLIYTGITVFTIIIFIIGATYAYFQASLGVGASTDVNVKVSSVDSLMFETTMDNLNLKATLQNFGQTNSSLSDSITAKAILKANNNTNTATSNYYVYLNIEENTFIYTTPDKAELLLEITDPLGNKVTSIEGLNYVTQNDISGFDVTTHKGLITIASNYEITTTSTKTDEWIVKLTLVNLDSNQNENMGKEFISKILIQKDKIKINQVKVNATSNSIQFNITETAQGLGNIMKYMYSKDNGNTWEESTNTIYEFSSLTPNTVYPIQIKAIDEGGIETIIFNQEVRTEFETLTRQAIIVWNDTDNEDKRPSSVTVNLLKNGEIYAVQSLSPQTNWRYTWEKLDARYIWQIITLELDNYGCLIDSEGATFVITCTFDDGQDPEIPEDPI